MAKIIDGKQLARSMREQLTRRAEAYTRESGRLPGLGVILVGTDPASEIYVRNKRRACDETGIEMRLLRFPENVDEAEILSAVQRLNNDSEINGVIVQLPLPAGMDETLIVRSVAPGKDVDGLNPLNAGALLDGLPGMVPCTPRAVMALLDSIGIELSGKRAVVVGRSNLVGKPLAMLLLARDATVTLCHSKTIDLAAICREADVLISAAGRPGFITEAFVKHGAVVIDVGTTRVDGRLCGDVDFESVMRKASWITPVPGGVGPMTVTMLLANTLDACGI